MTFGRNKIWAAALVLPTALTLTACIGSSSSSNDGSGVDSSGVDGSGVEDNSSYTTLDAATVFPKAAYLDLASGHTVNSDEQWHLSYQKYTGFKTNGGTSGSGSVEACVAKEYPELFDSEKKAVKAEFEKLTKDSTLADFNAVNKAACSEFESDAIKTQIDMNDWVNADYSNPQAPVFSAKTGDTNGWIVRSATKDINIDKYNYARVKVKTLQIVLGREPVRKAILSVEKWNHNNTNFDDAVDSPELDFSNGQVFWDMETNAVVTATDDWDMSIKLDGRSYAIQVNGGASGKGAAGIGLVMPSVQGGVAGVTDPTNTAQVYKYFGDTATGAMSKPGNYGALQYNVGGKHKMWPTYSVYLFKDGDKYYKAQVVSNYGPDGKAASGNLYIRYAEVID